MFCELFDRLPKSRTVGAPKPLLSHPSRHRALAALLVLAAIAAVGTVKLLLSVSGDKPAATTGAGRSPGRPRAIPTWSS